MFRGEGGASRFGLSPFALRCLKVCAPLRYAVGALLFAFHCLHCAVTYTFNGEYILPANASSPVNHATNHTVEEFSDLKVVVWLQDATTREVFQSAWATGGPINVSTNKLNADFGLKLFPNPANNQLFVNYNTQNATSVKFTLIDALGKVVKVQTTESIQGENSGLINVNELANGVYFLEVEIDGQKQSTRFVVAH